MVPTFILHNQHPGGNEGTYQPGQCCEIYALLHDVAPSAEGGDMLSACMRQAAAVAAVPLRAASCRCYFGAQLPLILRIM